MTLYLIGVLLSSIMVLVAGVYLMYLLDTIGTFDEIAEKIIETKANFKNKVATITDVVKMMWDYLGSLPKK